MNAPKLYIALGANKGVLNAGYKPKESNSRRMVVSTENNRVERRFLFEWSIDDPIKQSTNKTIKMIHSERKSVSRREKYL